MWSHLDLLLIYVADSYTEDDLVLAWEDDEPVELNSDELYLPQFELLRTSVDNCTAHYKTGLFVILYGKLHSSLVAY